MDVYMMKKIIWFIKEGGKMINHMEKDFYMKMREKYKESGKTDNY